MAQVQHWLAAIGVAAAAAAAATGTLLPVEAMELQELQTGRQAFMQVCKLLL
jgi:hypothetical protein